jgi:hypothetical protein
LATAIPSLTSHLTTNPHALTTPQAILTSCLPNLDAQVWSHVLALPCGAAITLIDQRYPSTFLTTTSTYTSLTS